jgi:hypothetical protein
MAVPMSMTECCRQASWGAQEAIQVERLPVVPLKNPMLRLAARVLEYEDHRTIILSPSQPDLEIFNYTGRLEYVNTNETPKAAPDELKRVFSATTFSRGGTPAH